MERARRLDSALIEQIRHDDEADTLAIRFRNRREYLYEQVPRAIYDALAKAPSAGSFFNERIKGHFPCHRLGKRYAP